MKRNSLFIYLFTIFFQLANLVLAADDYDEYAVIYCNSTSNCPEERPCCSTYGQCGTGSYCLGGCDPRFSFNNTACLPQPICKEGHYDLTTSQVQSTSEYLGNSSEYSWVYDGHVLDYDDTLILAMPQNQSGTVLSSTFFVWYGKVSVRFKSSHGAGVVSAAILFSNVKDEVDLEFIGNALEQPQTNYYFQGVLSLEHGQNLSTTNTYEEWHTYEIDWTEDSLKWGVDGEYGRTLYKNDTLNETSGIYMFPQTPSRIQISIWPAGDEDNAPGTIAWAGGEIDWNMSEFEKPGYLYALVDTVDVECYDVPDGIDIEEGANAYVYAEGQNDWAEDSVQLVKANTLIGDLSRSGIDLGLDDEDEDESPRSTQTDDNESSSSSITSTKNDKDTSTTETTLAKEASSTSSAASDFAQSSIASSTATGGAIAKPGVSYSISGTFALLASYLYLF